MKKDQWIIESLETEAEGETGMPVWERFVSFAILPMTMVIIGSIIWLYSMVMADRRAVAGETGVKPVYMVESELAFFTVDYVPEGSSLTDQAVITCDIRNHPDNIRACTVYLKNSQGLITKKTSLGVGSSLHFLSYTDKPEPGTYQLMLVYEITGEETLVTVECPYELEVK